jgi:hypothetical protein
MQHRANAMEITENKAFDGFVRERGWEYDNGGRYLDEYWDWYTGATAGLVLLRQAPDRLALVRFDGLNPTELWSGRVSTSEEFDQMLKAIVASGEGAA